MDDKNRNMDNQQTVYIPENQRVSVPPVNRGIPSQTPPNNMYGANPGVPPQAPPNNMYGANPGVPPQAPPNNMYGANPGVPLQAPPNNMYGANPGVPLQAPPNNMYGTPPVYGASPVGYNPPKKKGNGALIAMIVMIVVLILAIIGVSLFIVIQNSDDDDGRGYDDKSSYSQKYTDDNDDPQDLYDNEVQENTDAPPENDDNEQSTTEVKKKTVITPNVQGSEINQASQRLRETGFVVNIEEQYSDKPKNTVIAQSIEPGTTVDEGVDIFLTVSLGEDPDQEITVPSVQNKTFDDAWNELERVGLYVNSAYEENAAIDRNKVIDQSIPPGTKVKKGTSITLTVSIGSKEPVDTIKHGKVVTQETDLNVRKGPGTEYEVAGTIAKDSTVEIVEIVGKWYKIKFQNGYGYVSDEFIQIQN